MKLQFDFLKLSEDWHYNKYEDPKDELKYLDSVALNDHTLDLVERISKSPYEHGAQKRIHIGDTAVKDNNANINERSVCMRNVGYTENNYFIEFNNDILPDIADLMKEKYNLSYEHSCAIIIPPGQCMPVHGDTYSYLMRYMASDFSEIKYDLKKDVRRYLMFLTDWEWGQSIGAGNVLKWQWKKGDIFKWDHKLLHWSSNAGMKPVVFFEITGLEI